MTWFSSPPLRRWRTEAFLAAAVVLNYGARSILPAIFPALRNEFDLSDVNFGLLESLFCGHGHAAGRQHRGRHDRCMDIRSRGATCTRALPARIWLGLSGGRSLPSRFPVSPKLRRRGCHGLELFFFAGLGFRQRTAGLVRRDPAAVSFDGDRIFVACACSAGGLGILLAGLLKQSFGLAGISGALSAMFVIAGGALLIGHRRIRTDIARASAWSEAQPA